MTQEMERVHIEDPDELPRQRTAAPQASKPFWSRPWIIPLWLVTLAFLYFQVEPFVGTPEALAPVPPHGDFPAYYSLLITHIVFGTVSMLTVCLQVWPWLRRQYPAVHRISGRIYVAACVICGICGLIIMPWAPPVGKVGVTMSTTLWVITTVVAFWAVRAGRFALHRRFMLYSFALVMNNVWGLAMAKIVIGFEIQMDFTYLAESARWIGWVVNMMVVQWWLYHTERRPVEGPVQLAVR